nr:immunoglobulin heavy chain junction region [Macaca mulatta]
CASAHCGITYCSNYW